MASFESPLLSALGFVNNKKRPGSSFSYYVLFVFELLRFRTTKTKTGS